MKKIVSLALVLALCLSLLPVTVFAEEGGEIQRPTYSGGEGTQDKPYLLSKKEDILALRDFLIDNEDASLDADNCGLGAYHGYYFKLTNDIDMSDVEWTPFNFNGVLDGAGHTISNMQMNQNMFDTADPAEGEYKSQQYEAGFFGQLVHAHIRNLYFENCSATISDNLDPATQRDIYVGIVAGVAIASSFENISVVNCTVTQNGKPKNFGYAGGLVAAADSCYFNGCSFQNGQINVGGNAADNHTGGIAGVILDEKHAYMAEDSAFGMYQCFSTANINVTDSKYGTGGLVGWTICDELTDIYQDCYVGGSIVSDSDSVAGLIGGCSSKAEVKNCIVYADKITASKTVDPIHSPSTLFPDFDEAIVTNCKLSNQTVITGTKQTNNASITASSLTESEKQVPEFKSNLHGKLSDKTVGVEITLSQGETVRYTAVTNENGEYNFGKQVLPGTYTLDIAEDSDYCKYTSLVIINYAANSLLDVTREPTSIPVDEIKLNMDTLSMMRGATAILTAIVTPDTATDKTVTWISSDEQVATVENGIVTAVGSGTATITAQAGDKTATCIVTVTNPSSSGSSRPRYDVTTPSKPENGSVTVDPERARSGSRVTVTVTPDSGYKLGELVVTDRDGKKLELTDKGNGQYTFTMPSGKVEVAAEFVKEVEVSPFADVATDAYYYDAVKWAVNKGITNGVSETLFGPDQACTRAQIVTFLWRAAGSPEPKSGSSFADVAADAYYAKAVAWAVENGITKGTSETTFHPDETCTRAQGVTFLYRALGKLAAAQAGFTDVAADSYYADAVNWAAENGVTNGISETLFGPDGSCTRAQIVTFLYRAYQGK